MMMLMCWLGMGFPPKVAVVGSHTPIGKVAVYRALHNKFQVVSVSPQPFTFHGRCEHMSVKDLLNTAPPFDAVWVDCSRIRSRGLKELMDAYPQMELICNLSDVVSKVDSL